MANNKQKINFAKIEATRYGYIQKELETALSKMVKNGYEDIRTLFAHRGEINKIHSKNCRHGAITVEFYFGEIENSPINDYAIAQIKEFIKFCKEMVESFEKRQKKLEAKADA